MSGILDQLSSSTVKSLDCTILDYWRPSGSDFRQGLLPEGWVHNEKLAVAIQFDLHPRKGIQAISNGLRDHIMVGYSLMMAPANIDQYATGTTRSILNYALNMDRDTLIKAMTPAYLWTRGRLVSSWKEDQELSVESSTVRLPGGSLPADPKVPVKLAELPEHVRGATPEVRKKFTAYWTDCSLETQAEPVPLGITSNGVIFRMDGKTITWDGEFDFMWWSSPAAASGPNAPSPRGLAQALYEELTAATDEQLLNIWACMFVGCQTAPTGRSKDGAVFLLDGSANSGTMPAAAYSLWSAIWPDREHVVEFGSK